MFGIIRTLDYLEGRLRHIFNECKARSLSLGNGPGRLVLVPKGGREKGIPSAYRPIRLLDEIGKIFERIIADRLVQHLSRGRDLHEEQFVFREVLFARDERYRQVDGTGVRRQREETKDFLTDVTELHVSFFWF